MNTTIPQKRNLFAMAFFLLLTGGLYFFYWLYKTKEDINQLGGKIPTFWFAILPFLNIYFDYQYAQNFVKYVKHDDDIMFALMFFFLILCLPVVAPFVIQHALNNYKTARLAQSAQQQI